MFPRFARPLETLNVLSSGVEQYSITKFSFVHNVGFNVLRGNFGKTERLNKIGKLGLFHVTY